MLQPGKQLLRTSRAFLAILHCIFVSLLFLPSLVADAQQPQQVIQQVVDAERAANQSDHSEWIYLDNKRKPKERLLQWVADTQQGEIRRILEKDDQPIPEPQQREFIQAFLSDPRAQRKQLAEIRQDNKQVDTFLELLPIAFVWTRTGTTTSTTSLHFEPNTTFRPPTRETHVLSSMSGDLVADNEQHRIRSLSGRLVHDVTFGGGLLGRLKEGSSFALEQKQVGSSLWQLSSLHVDLNGNALLFKSISLQEDETRSRFQIEPSTITLSDAVKTIMTQPATELSTQKAQPGP